MSFYRHHKVLNTILRGEHFMSDWLHPTQVPAQFSTCLNFRVHYTHQRCQSSPLAPAGSPARRADPCRMCDVFFARDMLCSQASPVLIALAECEPLVIENKTFSLPDATQLGCANELLPHLPGRLKIPAHC